MKKEFKKEVEEEAEKESSGKDVERESFKMFSKEGASLSGDGEEDISKGIIWEDGLCWCRRVKSMKLFKEFRAFL